MAETTPRVGPGIAAVAASLLMLTASPTFAQGTGGQNIINYFSVGGGYTIQDNSKLSNSVNMKALFDDGAAIRAALGHDFGKIRLEGEIAYRDNNASTLRVTNAGGLPGVVSGPASGDVKAISYMVNALWDLDFGSKVTPYIGVGAGMAHIKLDSYSAGGPVTGYASDNTFAMQGIAGLAYSLSRKVDLTVDYRYMFAADDARLRDSLGRTIHADYGNHAVMVGLTFRFGGAAEPQPQAQPAAQPAPPPAPAPAPAPQAEQTPPPPPPAPAPQAKKTPPPTFIVFFDFNSAKITTQGQQVIDQAVKAAKDYGAARVIVTGYSDRSGPAAYNLKLSKRRAQSVHDAMVAQGVDAGEISTTAKGEENPLVPTKDGAREPQNRRAEIMIQ